MTEAKLIVNDLEVLAAFERLSSKQMVKARRGAMRRGASYLVSATRRELKKDYKVQPEVLRGVRSSISKDANTTKVHIMGYYTLKWLEKGTVKRWVSKKSRKPKVMLKKKRYVGFLKGKYFFLRAQTATSGKIGDIMISYLDKEIKKQFNKK